MQTQISAETIVPISHGDLPVITTELLASLYGTDPHSITKTTVAMLIASLLASTSLSWKVQI